MSQFGDHDHTIRMVGFPNGDDDVARHRREHSEPGQGDAPIPVVVQFRRPLSAAEQQRLRSSYGLDLSTYVPDAAYLETVDRETAARLADDGLVRAVVDYPAAAKVVPGIGDRVFRTEERQALRGIWLDVVLFDQADPEAVAGRVRDLEGVSDVQIVDDRPLGGSAHVRLVAESTRILDELAALAEVRVIDQVPERKMDNANAAGTIQSGTPGTRTVWDQGLHGEGQIIGMIDSSPVDIDHCFFRDADEQHPRRRRTARWSAIRNGGGRRPSSTRRSWRAAPRATTSTTPARTRDVAAPGPPAWSAAPRRRRAEQSMLTELSAAAAMGAAIHTNSWHDDDQGPATRRQYNQTAADVDTFTWNNEDHLVLGSAGNVGEEQGPPGTAKNAICVAAAMADPNEMQFGDGNAGPTARRPRRKPDIVAPGCGITSADVGHRVRDDRGRLRDELGDAARAGSRGAGRGSTTRRAGIPPGTRQPHHAFVPSGALLKATLAQQTHRHDRRSPATPSNTEGWGLIRLDNVLVFAGGPRDAARVGHAKCRRALHRRRRRAPRRRGEQHAAAEGHAGLDRSAGCRSAPPPRSSTTSTSRSSRPTAARLPRQRLRREASRPPAGPRMTLNNVEMVLSTHPLPGDWAIRVVGTGGQRRRSRARAMRSVRTADLTEPPVATGVQDTLVVRVRFADVGLRAAAAEPAEPDDRGRRLHRRGELRPDHASSRAFRGPIDARPQQGLLLPPRPQPADRADRGGGGEAGGRRAQRLRSTVERHDHRRPTTSTSPATGRRPGPGRTSCPAGFTRPISVSVQSYANPAARFTHGMLHQFGLVDLYAHEGVVFPRPYVDEWDNMAGLYTNVHPLVWSKERAGWLTAHGDTDRVHSAAGGRRELRRAQPDPAVPQDLAGREPQGDRDRPERGRGDAGGRERVLLRRGPQQQRRPTSTAACPAAACSSTTSTS